MEFLPWCVEKSMGAISVSVEKKSMEKKGDKVRVVYSGTRPYAARSCMWATKACAVATEATGASLQPADRRETFPFFFHHRLAKMHSSAV